MTTKQEQKKAPARREVFKLAGVGAASAAIVAAGAAPAETAVPGRPSDAGYRETDHVKRVYALARF
ncbi:MAG: formate dehydrogenase [Alphaproteobacteria bacterium]|nr:formate dehydrogenase [Alphaproteobacteria bacterium]